MPATRCGTFVLAGTPNAGKSSLMNRLVGQNVSIISPRPQTTRLPVVGVRTDGDTQLLFVDLPGLLDPQYGMHHAMLTAAADQLRRADGVLYLHPAHHGAPPPLPDLLPPGVTIRAPVLTVLTKTDMGLDLVVPDAVPSSAVTGQGIEAIIAWCTEHAPLGEFTGEPDEVSTQPVRFFVTEFVREAAFQRLGDELPYAIAVEVDEFREAEDPVYIRATIYVERDSQKGIVVGKQGRTIKALGAAARKRIEALLERQVYLDLWVKTLPKWRSSPAALERFGFPHSPMRHP